MKKLIIPMILSLLLLNPIYIYAQEEYVNPDPVKVIVKKVITQSVSILTLELNGFSSCSGVVLKNTIDESIVLTAKHCVELAEEIYVDNLIVKTIGISLNDDLAFLKLDEFIPYKSPVTLANSNSQRGDWIVGIGYPKNRLFISFGNLTIITSDWQIVQIHMIKGCSGGGIFNKDGELIGILWGSFFDETFGIFERLEDIHKFVNDNKLLE